MASLFTHVELDITSNMKTRNQLALIPPMRNSEDPAFDKKRSYSYRGEIKKLDHVDT